MLTRKMADCEGRLSPACLEDLEEESLDPRIQGELERLNKASEEINKLELELDDRRATFRQALSESTHKLNTLAKKLGACVDKARPYYDARHKAKEAHIETQKVAIRYERACSMHEAAKEMVQLAEQGYMCREEPSDPAWQEMLNHATMKVNEAEKERNESEKEHMRTTQEFKDAEEKVQRIQKDLKRTIAKSKPYYEMKVKFNQMMEDQKRSISVLEEDVFSAKTMYSEALRNLETISDEIHQQRVDKRKNQELGERGAGVGSESPSPPPNQEYSGEGHDSSYRSSYTKDGYFSPPSVIYSSPEKARNQSYREAIDNRSEGQESLSEMEEIPEFTWEEEYKHLPPRFSPQGTAVGRVHRTSLSESEQDKAALSSSPRSSYISSSPRDSYLSSNRTSSLSTSPREQGKNFHTEELHVAPASSSEIVSESLNSKEGTLSSGSPAGNRKKLQGLILKIDTMMDPLCQSYQTKKIMPTRSGQKSQNRPHSTPEGVSHQQSVDSEQANMEMRRKLSVQSPSRRMSPAYPGSDKSLSIPGSTEADADNSDTESIASTGPMLDDDQVEMLTLEFSDKSLADGIRSPVSERFNWNRMSLPPTLTNVEAFLHKQENSIKEKRKSSTVTGADSQTSDSAKADKEDTDIKTETDKDNDDKCDDSDVSAEEYDVTVDEENGVDTYL